MKKLLVGIILGLSLTLGGCGGQFSILKEETIEQMNPQEKVVAAIKQTKAAVTALIRGATADRKVGVYNDAEWHNLKANFNDLDKTIKDAERYAALGDLVTAGNRHNSAKVILDYVKANLIKQKDNE